VGARQGQKYLAELEQAGLIRRVSRFTQRAQTSNTFEFLWHELFVRGANDCSGEGVNDNSPRGVNDRSPKESHLEESHSEEGLRLSAHESQKTRFAPGLMPSRCKQHPSLKQALADYMREGKSAAYGDPSDREVVDILDAAQPATEQEVVECLRYLYEERGLRPGTRNGPRHYSWFQPVIAEYFQNKRDRRLPAPAETAGYGNHGGLSQSDFDAMTEVLN
jgi:hypothetical protein